MLVAAGQAWRLVIRLKRSAAPHWSILGCRVAVVAEQTAVIAPCWFLRDRATVGARLGTSWLFTVRGVRRSLGRPSPAVTARPGGRLNPRAGPARLLSQTTPGVATPTFVAASTLPLSRPALAIRELAEKRREGMKGKTRLGYIMVGM